MVLIDTDRFIGHTRTDILREIEALRMQIWTGPHFDLIRKKISIDTIDLAASHVICRSGELLVGAGRISFHGDQSAIPDRPNFSRFLDSADFPAAFLNRLVVSEQFRNKGVARIIDRERLALCNRRHRSVAVFAEATGSRVGALMSLGFQITGESPDRSYPGIWKILRKSLMAPVAGGNPLV